MPNWKRLSKEVVYKTNWITILKSDAIDHRGNKITYSYVELPHPAVSIVAMNKKGEIFMQKQYRYTIDTTLWEVPAGGSDGQDPLVAAKRELTEETGMVSAAWAEIGTYYAFDGSGNCKFHIFLANDAVKVKDNDGVEDIVESGFFPASEISRMIRSGELICSESIASISMALLNVKSGKENLWQ